jgi:hypothetical protein
LIQPWAYTLWSVQLKHCRRINMTAACERFYFVFLFTPFLMSFFIRNPTGTIVCLLVFLSCWTQYRLRFQYRPIHIQMWRCQNLFSVLLRLSTWKTVEVRSMNLASHGVTCVQLSKLSTQMHTISDCTVIRHHSCCVNINVHWLQLFVELVNGRNNYTA